MLRCLAKSPAEADQTLREQLVALICFLTHLKTPGSRFLTLFPATRGVENS